MPNCINCNTNLDDAEKYCPICGQIQTTETTVEEPEIVTTETAEPEAESQPKLEENQPQQGAYPPPQGTYPPPPQGAYPPPQGGYYPPYAQPFYPPPVLNGNAGAMLIWGIVNIALSVFCCMLLNLVPAIIAVVYANKAKSSFNQLDYDKNAKTALILNIVSSALTVLLIIALILLAVLGVFNFNTTYNY